jgi:hypothetical protein
MAGVFNSRGPGPATDHHLLARDVHTSTEPRPSRERDDAWRAYSDAACVDWTPRDEAIAKLAFNQGWKSRDFRD